MKRGRGNPTLTTHPKKNCDKRAVGDVMFSLAAT